MQPNVSTCIITAKQPGDARYLAAPTVTQSFTYSKAVSKIDVRSLKPITVTGEYIYATTSKANGVGGSTVQVGITTTTPEICTVNDVYYTYTSSEGTRATLRAVKNGNCVIKLSFPGSPTLLPTDSTWQSTISGVTEIPVGSSTPQTISFPALTDREYGPAATLNAVATSGLPITYKVMTPNDCQIIYPSTGPVVQSLSNTSNLDSRLCTVEASQPGDSRYAAAKPIQQSFNWIKTAMKITVSNSSVLSVRKTHLVDAAISFVDVAKMGGMQSLGHTLNVTSADLSVCTISSTSPFSARGGAGIYSRSRVTTYKNGTCTLNFVFTGTNTRKATSLVWSATVMGR